MHKNIITPLLLILGITVGIAQQSSMLDLEKLTTKVPTTQSTLLTGTQVPTIDVVDPLVYTVGPGDVLGYQTTGLDFSEKLVVVTPENSILLERVGLVDVNGMTLSQVRDRVKQIIAERSGSVEVFLTLKRSRLVYVTIEGDIPFPGTYAVPASTRVSSLIRLNSQPWLLRTDPSVSDQVRGRNAVYSVVTSAASQNGVTAVSAYALRNIMVRHRNGVSAVDLALAKVKGQGSADPHVSEGDVIVVPYSNAIEATSSISGAVATPTSLAFKQGDRVSLLLAAAGGATPNADLNNVVLVQGDTKESITLNVTPNLSLIGEDIELQPGSVITVGQHVTAGADRRQGTVQVYGEVQRPGAVIITPGVTTISQVLSDVGGVRTNAALSLSYIVRPDAQHSDRRMVSDVGYQNFMYSDLKLEDTLRFQMDQLYRIPYVSCDLATALSDTTSVQNVAMQDGDVVVIVPMPNRVFVYGQVNQPGYVPYVPNKTLDWYVQRAGGFAAGAAESRVRIVRGKTKVWVEDDDGIVVQPGDEVYAPRPPAVPASVELQTWAMVAGILSSAAALLATVISLTR